MSEKESFDIKKMVASPFTGLYWVKTVMFSLGAVVLFFISFAVYKAYIKKPEPSQAIHAESGSHVTVVQQNQKKRVFIPFIEGGVEQPSHDDFETYLRGGLRFEF